MTQHLRKPEWLKVRIGMNDRYSLTHDAIRSHGLHTICQSGRCPNKSECWARGTATLMIAGDICTRSCKFCNTRTGRPMPLDPDEPEKVAESIARMQLRHAVITSVDRDDLPDLGAAHWAETILAVRRRNPDTRIEVLLPDFQGREDLLEQVIVTCPDVLAHNLETVRRLTPSVRSAARYDRSLDVLRKMSASGILTKSSLMVGLGETDEEVRIAISDLYETGCRILTVGQYLQPTHRHHPVLEYVHPDRFAAYAAYAKELGFLSVESGPLVRSSYHRVSLDDIQGASR